jgi:ectoine hydroxylase-related dioxygenase (phytanoyl-CoA dioxygenase family)
MIGGAERGVVEESMLNEGQVRSYHDNGYLVVADVISPEALAKARARLVELVEASRRISLSDGVYDLEGAHSAREPRVRRIKDPHKVDRVYADLRRSPEITDIVAQLIGPNLRTEHSKLNIKPAGGGEPVEWRQDWAFYPHTNDDILEVGVMIEARTLENGPLLMIPGSHRGPVFDHHHLGYFAGATDPVAQGLDVSKAVAITGEAGSISLHHVRTVHGSRDNLSTRDRPLLLFGYCAADAWPLRADASTGLESFNARMLRGEPTLQPHLRDAPARMPYPPAVNQGPICQNQKLVRGRSFASSM